MKFREIFLIFSQVFIQKSLQHHEFAACDYKFTESGSYKCELTLNIPNGIANITEILGNHVENRTDYDVTIVETTFVSSAEYLPSIICKRFSNIVSLSIQTGLEKIDENSVKNCKNLKNLNFFFNKIREISANSFAGNKELETVDLSGNQLTSLSPKLFHSQLKKLWLQGNQQLLLSSDFFVQIPNLSALSLSNYHPGWFRSLRNLEELHIGPSNVLELPVNLLSPLKSLKILFLNEKNVTVLHADTFGLLPNLTQLWMKNCGIKAVDEKIFSQTNVTDVNFEGNECADGRFRGDVIKELTKCFENYKGRGSEQV